MLQSEYVKIVNFYSRIFSCKRCRRAEVTPQESHSSYLFVMTPCTNVDEDDESDEEDGKEGKAVKAMNSMISEKFRELNSILSKRVIPSIMNFQEDTSTRLESIEKNNVDLRKSLTKDAHGKFAKMKEDLIQVRN